MFSAAERNLSILPLLRDTPFTISDQIFLCKCLTLQIKFEIFCLILRFDCSCCVCQRECTSVLGLQSHLRMHKSKEPSKVFPCTECEKIFYTKSHLKRHLERLHGISMLKSLFLKKHTKRAHYNRRSNKNWYDPLISFIIVVPTKKRDKNPAAPDSNAIKTFFDMNCDVCDCQLASLQHAKLHYLEEHNIDGYIKVRTFIFHHQNQHAANFIELIFQPYFLVQFSSVVNWNSKPSKVSGYISSIMRIQTFSSMYSCWNW